MYDFGEHCYTVVRFYQRHPVLNGETVLYRVTLEEAQAHCSDPETSSSTATGAEATERTERYGPWFDGYQKI